MIPVAKPYLTKEEAQNAYDTILTNWVTQGPKVQEFEEKFAAYVGSKYAVAVSNCTTALHLSLIVSDIKTGDEVICPSLTFIATANAITYTGASPVFCEVDPITMNIDPLEAEKLITPKTKAILIVHQIGLPADIDAFKEICRKHHLILIEDAACAVGSSYKGRKIGAHSDLVCFSFHPRKVITTGDGGMITTSNEAYYNRLKLLRQHGMSVNDRVRHLSSKIIFENYNEVGYNYRMTDIQAAVGIRQLEKLDFIVAERRKIALQYQEALKDIGCINLPYEPRECVSNYQSFNILIKENSPLNRNDLMQKMLDARISTRRGIMTIHTEAAYESYNKIKLSISENFFGQSIIIPLFIPMEKGDVDHIINTFRYLLKK